MTNIKELTKKDFNEFISNGDVVVDFWAEWCGPCKLMEPHYEKAAQEEKNIKFGKVNVEEAPELAERFQVMSIPTTIFFKNGEQVDRTVGALSKDMIISRIKDNF